MIFLESVIILFSVFILFEMIRKYKRFHCIYPIIAVFDLAMVAPLVFELFLGTPSIPRDVYYNYIKAMNDDLTLMIYCGFVLLFQIAFWLELIRIKKKDKKIQKAGNINEGFLLIQTFKYKNIIIFFCYLIFIFSVFAVAFSPDPLYYLTFRSVHYLLPQDIIDYSEIVISPIFQLLFVAIICLKLFDSKNNIFGFSFRGLMIVFFTVVNGKRTYLMITVAVNFLIDLLRSGSIKKIIPKYIVMFGLVAFYFYEYMYLTDKISYNNNWYYEINEYIFRSMHTRFSIYQVLHPEEIHMLDYPGQTMLYNLFYFVPRAIWNSKPLPYIDYYMKSLLELPIVADIRFHMPASYYPEFISNFGLFGIPISLFFTITVARFFDNRKTACQLIGIALVALLNIYYYNDLLKIVAAFVLFMYLNEKINIGSKTKEGNSVLQFEKVIDNRKKNYF